MYMESFGGIHAQTKEQYFTFDFCFVAQSDSFFSRSLSLLLYCCFFFLFHRYVHRLHMCGFSFQIQIIEWEFLMELRSLYYAA